MFNQFPKIRPLLPKEVAKIYETYYKNNRTGSTPFSRLSQWAESWLHNKVASDVRFDHSPKSTLEIGAGTLNQLRFEPKVGPYDIVEPFSALYKGVEQLNQVRTVYRDMVEVPSDCRYDRITSIAAFEHICNLPEVIARTGLLMSAKGSLRVSIPSEGTFLWRLAWELTTGIEFRIKYGLDFGALRRHEHVNSAREIESLLEWFFEDIHSEVLGISKGISLYQFYVCTCPDVDRCDRYLTRHSREGGVLNRADCTRNLSIAVVIPSFEAHDTVADVVDDFQEAVEWVIVVDDGSLDGTAASLEALGIPNLVVLHHGENRGVGAATKSGIKEALRRKADIVVKVDSDGQMSSDWLHSLLEPLVENRADVAKANRWHDQKSLSQMPLVRRIGNLSLSFLTRLASGYWSIFDPSNGYVAWRTDLLKKIDFDSIPDRWTFETAMLVESGIVRAVVEDVGIPARYTHYRSHLRIGAALPALLYFLLKAIPRRIWRQYFVLDFGPFSLLLAAGIPLVAAGSIFGGFHWWESYRTGVPATAGTVIVAALPIVLGFNCLLQALMIDVTGQPDKKISSDL
jgi:glycosyltransferase involved in cell wall biosynthesis